MKKKRFILFLFLGFFVGEIQAQFDAQFSQYAENKEAINPGAVAENGLTNLFLVYKMQWMGFKNSPSNLFASVNTPIDIAGTKHGVGLFFTNNTAGLFTNNSVLLQYSYKMKLFDGVLGLGLNAGAAWQAFRWGSAKAVPEGAESGMGNDYHEADVFPRDSVSLAFDAGVGAFFSNKKMYAGLSVSHLTAPNMDHDGSPVLYLPRIFYLTGGYNIPLSNALYTVKPSTLIKTDFISMQAELTGLLEYDKKIYGGLSYRFQDAFIFIVGMNLFDGLYAACSYDLPTSKMITSGGSLEVSIRYSFQLEFGKKNRHVSDRIL